MNTAWIESAFFEELIKTKNLSAADEKLAREYHENGLVVLPGMFPEAQIDAVREAAERTFDKGNPDSPYRDRQRIQDLWTTSAPVKALACDPAIIRVVEMLYGREAIPFQTLNFSEGSQQRAHSDTIHFSSLPARYMCGVWVALEDTTPENGALFYCPKSHKLPDYTFAHFSEDMEDKSEANYVAYEDFIGKIVALHGFERQPFYAKKGDALIWSSNLLHGGSPVTRWGSSRWSQVTHYFFKDCIYYTPLLSNMVTHELYIRNDLVNMRTGKLVEHTYNGVPIRQVQTASDKFILNNRLVREPARGQPFAFPVAAAAQPAAGNGPLPIAAKPSRTLMHSLASWLHRG